MAFNLLSLNAKLEKSVAEFDVITAGLSLAPARRAGGPNLCPNAGFCAKLCLGWFSGRMVTSGVRSATIRRAQLLINDPELFRAKLRDDLHKVCRLAQRDDKRAYVRLNVTTDLVWDDIVREYPSIQFYDYTKIKSRIESALRGKLPTNYWLTASYSERMPWSDAQRYLAGGLNLAVCFSTYYRPQIGRIDPLPTSYRGFPVIDGDKHDLRLPEFDGTGAIVGLRYKGPAALLAEGIKRGFVVEG